MTGTAYTVPAPTDSWGPARNAEHSADLRRRIVTLSSHLAKQTRSHLLEVDRDSIGNDRLVVVVLRGGALLCGGFTEYFDDADVCLIAIKRTEAGGRVCRYMTDLPRGAYTTAVYVDCVAGTGETVLAVRRHLGACCTIGRETVSVLCSSAVATDRLTSSGLDVVGFSLDDDLDGGLVLPDIGAADAGDLFSSASPWPEGDHG